MQEHDSIKGWLKGQIPSGWWTEMSVAYDRDEILTTGRLPEPEFDESDSDELRRQALVARIEAFREETRSQRIAIARRAESRFERKVSWGVSCGEVDETFTTLSVPAMTRLRLSERQVLDTLVDVGAARSRSDALAWCVRLVEKNQEEWLAELRTALEEVHAVRNRGPA